ncbi:MAG: HAD family hydrolase [Nitrospiria bacterium]
MEINHLIFDLGNTLIDFDLHLASGRLSKHFAVPEGDLYSFLFESDFFTRFERGDIGPAEVVATLNQKYDQDITIDQFDRMFSPIFTPRLKMVSLIESLKEDFELSLLSNTNMLHSRYIEGTYSFLKSFDHLFYSFALRALKPQPEIFHEVLSRTHSSPEECLLIDDIEKHGAGARKVGISSIHFKSEENLKKELEAKGIFAG